MKSRMITNSRSASNSHSVMESKTMLTITLWAICGLCFLLVIAGGSMQGPETRQVTGAQVPGNAHLASATGTGQ